MANNTITLTNTYSKFTGPNIWQAREVLKYRQKGYIFTRAYKRGGWNGYVYLMNNSGKFAAGLSPWLTERLAQEGIEVERIDARPAPPPVETRLTSLQSNIKLREHQRAALAVAQLDERGVIWHPTGAGKTEVMIELARSIGRPGLVLVHRKDLMYQTMQRFQKTLGCGEETIGIIGDGYWEPRIITVATFQTLYARVKERLPEVERWLREDIIQVHVDEAHHLPAKSYERVMAQLWSARWRLGYSATPDKEGDLETFFKVAGFLGPTVHRVTPDELAEQGYLVPVDVFMIEMPSSPVTYKNWPEAVQYGIIDNHVRNQRIIDLANRLVQTGSGPVVILVERLEHGKLLADRLSVGFMAGSASSEERQQAWDDLREGRRNIIVASVIADEGLDIPPLAYLILAGGGKAPHRTIQRIGRGMRTAEGKDRLYVFDFSDEGKYLAKHAKRRRQTYEEQPACTLAEVSFEEVCP